MKSVRLLFIEEDNTMSSQLEPHYKRFLSHCGYEATFIVCQNESQARRAVEVEDPHGFICDLGYDNSYAGLHLIRTLRSLYPDLFCIGTSQSDYPVSLIDTRQPSFHMYLDKSQIISTNEKYMDMARSRFLDLFQIETSVRISNIDKLPINEFQRAAAKRELVCLIRQVVFAGHEPDELMVTDEVNLEPLGGGLSGSFVFKMTSRNSKSGIIGVPAVLKISERRYAKQEKDNYHKFVKWGLPYTWRVDVLGYGESKSYGAIAYSFVLSDLKKFEPLAELLRRAEDERVKAVLDSLFSPELRRWYGDALIRQDDNIVERYVARYFRGAETKSLSNSIFRDVVQSEFNAKFTATRIQIDGLLFEDPGPCLFGRPRGSYQSCICHGDLNSNNVMVAENSQVIFIDFQETGRGHVFEDFIAMESSVRLNYGEDALRGRALLNAELDLQQGDDVSNLHGIQRIAAMIRRLARKNFPAEDFRSYYYGVAAYSYRLLRAKGLTSAQKARAVASILAATKQLSAPKGVAVPGD